MPAQSSAAEARTTVVRPADPTLHSALRLAAVFALAKLVIQIGATLYSQHLGYSYFRDEFYYLICGRRLAWGYVDHGPLVAIQARLSESLFGTSVLGIRMLSHLAGALVVFLTGILTWALGGRRSAQSLAMLGILVSPEFLALDSFLSMNSVEPVFWIFCTLALVRIVSGASSPKWWTLFGLSAGLGLLNKPSMAFFLVALGLALLLTPQRTLLFSRWCALAITLLVLISLPNLLWQIQHGWPTLEFLRNGKLAGKNVILPFPQFLFEQVQMLHPLNALLWVTGLVVLVRGKTLPSCRWMGLTYLLFFALMYALHAKDYYLAPVYPLLFAAGALGWERRFPRRRNARRSALALPLYASILIVTGVLVLPMSLPVLTPSTWVAYTSFLHLRPASTENQKTSALPQFYADRFGWQQYVDLFDRAYNSLSPADQSHVTLWADNYGEAGAIDFLGARQHLGLPPMVSGHNTYWIWGPGSRGGDLVIAVSGSSEDLRQQYESVTLIGSVDDPYAMPYEHKGVYLLRHRRPERPFSWTRKKDYI